MPDAAPFGFLNIDKPLRITSHDVVAKVRRKFGLKRVGHAGTLDPLASGVLVICLGQATRLSEYVMDTTKQYEARVRLGATTTTYDAEGDIVEQRDASHITRADVERVLPRFTGDIMQTPPIYSAIKVGGRKLYDIARSGETVELEPRPVTIHSLEILDWSPPEFTLRVTCSAGTYIRSLAFDLGSAVNVGAYLAGLVRTASGRFTVQDAVALDTLLDSTQPEYYLISPHDAFAQRPTLDLESEAADHLKHGRALPAQDAEEGTLAFAYENGGLVAVVRAEGSLWKPQKVFTA